MTPYFERDGITIYHADARDVLPGIVADVLITDPPYGVELGKAVDPRAGTGSFGLPRGEYASYDDTYESYCAIVVPAICTALERVKRGAVFTGPHYRELPKADAIGGIYCPSGQGRNRWGFKTLLPILLYGTSPILQSGHGGRAITLESTVAAAPNGHPCPKPLEWMRWLISIASLPGEAVCDPFMGSGATIRAALDLGRRAIGIEIEERYCEIAATRLSQMVLPLESA